jgi:E3 ubiquitin-protein ligase RBX1
MPKFKISKIELKGEWSFDIFGGDICCICRNSLMDKSVSCSINNNNNNHELCKPIVGVCNHAFHSDCINSWIRQSYKKTCPICNQKWKLRKVYDKNYIDNYLTENIDNPKTTICLPNSDRIDGLEEGGGRL